MCQKLFGVIQMYNVKITRLPGNDDLPLPARMSSGASGFDLFAAVAEEVQIKAGERALIPTGIKIALPQGLEAQVRPRSGLALRYGVTVLNAPGTVDADYRGEIKVVLINHGDAAFTVKRGLRIAQLVIQEVPQIRWEEVDILSETDRGDGGFGHTGI